MMNTCKRLSLQALVALLLAGCYMAAAGCGARQQSARDDTNKVSPVSEVAPKLEPRESTAPAVLSATAVASVGECGPRYANGLRGSCINSQPCRGIGVLDQSGKAVCACYARAGGCSESERCDAIKKACVPENEPGFGRAPDD